MTLLQDSVSMSQDITVGYCFDSSFISSNVRVSRANSSSHEIRAITLLRHTALFLSLLRNLAALTLRVVQR
jgi:hypothetical protein